MDAEDLKLIQKLVRIMSRGEVTELEIEDPGSGLKLKLKRGSGEAAGPPLVQWMPPQQALAFGAPSEAVAGSAAASEAGEDLPPGAEQVLSPMVGTFYTSAAPDAEPFVKVGGEVVTDEVICIIEAMKVMNEIRAEVAGEVLEILVDNGEPVEFGQPLFLVKTR